MQGPERLTGVHSCHIPMAHPLRSALLALAALACLAAPLRAVAASRATPPAIAPAGDARQGPVTAPVGAFLTQLGDFDVQKKTFSASMWVWTVAHEGDRSVLDTLEFPNAVTVQTANTVRTPTAHGLWLQKKVVGTFRHAWDLRRFPFDRQHLVIALEESDRDTTELVYAPDTRNSSIDSDVRVPGWRITGARLTGATKRYQSTFGNPDLAPGAASSYTRVEFAVDLVRTDHSGFWKLTAAAFAAAGLALFSFFLHVGQTASVSPRFSMLAGSVFAAVVSMRSASGELGNVSNLTLVDEAHLAVLGYIFLATLAAIFSWYYVQKHGDAAASARHDRIMAVACTAALVVALAALVARAAWG